MLLPRELTSGVHRLAVLALPEKKPPAAGLIHMSDQDQS
jgi:hypothetical protein